MVTVASIGMSVLLVMSWRQSGAVQVAEAKADLATQCASVVRRYQGASPAARAASPESGLLEVVLQLVLQDASGVEGGAWERSRGFIAYTYPTYDGSGTKTDVPAAESDHIMAVAWAALTARQAQQYEREGNREAVLIAACPLDAQRAIWTMTRVARGPAHSSALVAAGIGVLMSLVMVSAWVLMAMLRRWQRRLAAMEQALQDATGVPALPLTGSPEVDRLADAVMAYASRLAASHREAESMSAELRRHERLVTLGRMTATVAHEIRNPIATMRLVAENALADERPSEHEAASAAMMLAQVRKLDALVESLLSMVQPMRLHIAHAPITPWLNAIEHEAHEAGMRVAIDRQFAPDLSWPMDRDQLARAVENLLRNATEHAPGHVGMTVANRHDALWIAVTNPGQPLAPEVAERLFEPFASGRKDGNGLGLALVREIAQGHGGRAHYERRDGIHTFSMEIPWRTS